MNKNINIRWWHEDRDLTLEEEEQLTEEAITHITPLIVDGYNSGELISDREDDYFNGWWHISDATEEE